MQRYQLVILFLISFNSFSQKLNADDEQVGYLFDAEGKMIYHSVNFTYQPEEVVSRALFKWNAPLEGVYYDLGLQKHEGQIKLSENVKTFKFIKDGEKTTIGRNNCRSYIIGEDSIIYEEAQKLNAISMKEAHVLEHEISFQDYSFFYYWNSDIGGAQKKYVFQKNNGAYQPFVIGGRNLKPQFTTDFKEFPRTIELLEHQKRQKFGTKATLKTMLFEHYHDLGERIFFDKSWNRVANGTDMHYSIQVDSITKSGIYLSYFHKDKLMYQGAFVGFYPEKKHGKFTFFYKNGKKQKEFTYEDNKLTSTMHYRVDGTSFEKFVTKGTANRVDEVYDANGKNILDKEGNGIVTHFDNINNRLITNEYQKNSLYSSYFEENGEKIYLLAPVSARYIFFNQYAMKLEGKLKKIPYTKAESKKSGLTLVELLIDEKGKANSIKLIRSVDENMDAVLLEQLEDLRKKAAFEPGKIGKKAVKQLVVLPFYYFNNIPDKYHHSHWTDGLGGNGNPVYYWY